MKILVTLLLVSNLAVLWFYVLRGNVTFSFGKKKNTSLSESENPSVNVGHEPVADENLVKKSTIHLNDLRTAVAKILPAMVHDEVKEYLQEAETEFADEEFRPAKHRFKPVDNIDKAFEDNRTEGPADGQPIAPAEDDESIPAFDDLDKGMRTLKDPTASDSDKKQAVGAMLSIDGTNLVMALPEPLHSNFINLIADYTAKQIDRDDSETASNKARTTTTSSKSKAVKPLPDKIEDFNIRDYRNQ